MFKVIDRYFVISRSLKKVSMGLSQIVLERFGKLPL